MRSKPILLPYPQNLKFTNGACNLSGGFIRLDCDYPQSLLFTANRLQAVISSLSNMNLEISASNVLSKEAVKITLRLTSNLENQIQGYHLHITIDEIVIESPGVQGIFYGCITLIQLLYFYNRGNTGNEVHSTITIPCMEIIDYPDFLNRGVMLDISRDKVPTMETTYNLVDLLASWKINQLQLYTEHTFAYHQHPEVWKDSSPFTGEEILLLDKYCQDRFIELVPNQNSFGHLNRWLINPRYNELAESPKGFDFPWGYHQNPYSLCPINPKSIDFLSGLYDELLPHFSSKQFNVGCDETFDLGQGYSKAICEQHGIGNVYLDFIIKIYNEVNKRNRIMQFWGDIIIAYPQLIPNLPKDVIPLEWGYESNHPFDEHCGEFSRTGYKFFVCPGTSSWNSISGRTDNCIANLTSAAINGKKYGAIGYLITDWGDNGHWQMLPVSYLGQALGAAYAWSYPANSSIDIEQCLSLYAFDDITNNTGKLFYDIGNAYHKTGIELENSTVLFNILQQPIRDWEDSSDKKITIHALKNSLDFIQGIADNIHKFNSSRNDKYLIKRELSLTIDLLIHSCMRGLYALNSSKSSTTKLKIDLQRIISEYKEIWLLRNRPGGLSDSVGYFEHTLNDYL